MSEEADFYRQLRDKEKALQEENTRLRQFKIPKGWGGEWFVAYTDTGLKSNPYQAVNYSIAHDKALMVKPDNAKVSRVDCLPGRRMLTDESEIR